MWKGGKGVQLGLFVHSELVAAESRRICSNSHCNQEWEETEVRGAAPAGHPEPREINAVRTDSYFPSKAVIDLRGIEMETTPFRSRGGDPSSVGPQSTHPSQRWSDSNQLESIQRAPSTEAGD